MLDSHALINLIQDSLAQKKHLLTPLEQAILEKEFSLADRLINEPIEINALAIAMAKAAPPMFHNIEACLRRVHDIVGVGCLSSCLSSWRIVEAFESFGLLSAAGTDPRLIVGRGHIAALFYAIRYCNHGFPLAFLYSLHHGVSGVVCAEFGFSNTMRHALGEAVAASVGQAIYNAERGLGIHSYCFSGDGELNEGITFEAIRIAYENNVSRYTLIVDHNEYGIERLKKPLNIAYLQSFFDRVHIVDGQNKEAILNALKACTLRGKREAIVCKTQKGQHSYQHSKQLTVTTTCKSVAAIIARLRSHQNVHLISPDLAGRFGFSDDGTYLNTGLSEQASVAMLGLLPSQDVKCIVTDDKYLLNALDCLQSIMSSNSNIQLILARKNSVWGGPVVAHQVFASLDNAQVYELCDPDMLESLLLKNIKNKQNTVYLLYDQPLASVTLLRPAYQYINNHHALYHSVLNKHTLLISTESFATQVHKVANALNMPHLRLFQLRPKINTELLNLLNMFSKIIVFEYNPSMFGLGEYIAMIVTPEVHSICVENYDNAAVAAVQQTLALSNHEQLLKITKAYITNV